MAESAFDEKKRLLKQFHEYTILQLQAVQAEDSEKFLEAVDACQPIMQAVDRIDRKMAFSDQEQAEFRQWVGQIMQLREQISQLTPELYRKLQQASANEQRAAQLGRAYTNENYAVPSIFYDKRK